MEPEKLLDTARSKCLDILFLQEVHANESVEGSWEGEWDGRVGQDPPFSEDPSILFGGGARGERKMPAAQSQTQSF